MRGPGDYHEEEHSRSNCQLVFANCLQAMRSIHLDYETFRSRFTKTGNIADDGVVTMELMPTCDHHLQSNCRIASVFGGLGEAAEVQMGNPGNVDVTLAYSELKEQRDLVFKNHIKQTIHNMHIVCRELNLQQRLRG